MVELTDTKLMTAEQKKVVLRQWERFLRGGLRAEDFSKALYDHLLQHCSFIAHYDIHGFYDTYFSSGDDTVHFLSQFDRDNPKAVDGIPPSIEYGMYYWAKGEYGDINQEMIRIATPCIPILRAEAEAKQRDADLTMAQNLLHKHGIDPKIGNNAGKR
jgi:hypothetical protein